jgi:mycoredoxin
MNDCADCKRSKAALKRLGVPYDEVNVDEVPEATKEVMRLNNGRRTLPTIVIGGSTVLGEPTDRELERALRGAATGEGPIGLS